MISVIPLASEPQARPQARIAMTMPEKLMRVLGNEDMPENFDFGGMSGGPVVAIVQTPTLRSWIPAGVIFQGPDPSDDLTTIAAINGKRERLEGKIRQLYGHGKTR